MCDSVTTWHHWSAAAAAAEFRSFDPRLQPAGIDQCFFSSGLSFLLRKKYTDNEKH